jgi:hypothetical protein
MVGAAAGAGNDQTGLDFAEPRADAFDNRPIAAASFCIIVMSRDSGIGA